MCVGRQLRAGWPSAALPGCVGHVDQTAHDATVGAARAGLRSLTKRAAWQPFGRQPFALPIRFATVASQGKPASAQGLPRSCWALPPLRTASTPPV